ncbi:flavodoxin domain-containing protein [Vibrio sp. HN007]|uniref:flavodoxin domain-containing protein n=1 Tax=Vibrio iocasae TaxID=3098914 RepID=UPI0035D48709
MNKFAHALMSILFTPVYADQDVLVCYASQTGTAANLANQSGDIIRQSGRSANISSLSSLKPSDFDTYKQVLMIVSTCGDGEIPDDGKQFYELLKQYPSLSVPVSILALGDQSYEHFCLAGKLMHEELQRMGAVREEVPVTVSGNPMDIWRRWLSEQLDQEIDNSQGTALSTPVKLSLASRTPLHSIGNEAPTNSNQAYQLTFDILSEMKEAYKVNDLMAIIPEGSEKERLYSIASSPTENPSQISLCVAKHQFMLDGELKNGACSDYLINQLEIGTEFDVSVKTGNGMALPDSDIPTILISTGAGIAPMMSVLKEREQQHHTGENWFIFGNRYSEHDYYYQQELEEYENSNFLTHLETTFSRDDERKMYVQNKFAQNKERLAEWLLNKNAQLYVCGRPELKDEILSVVSEALEPRFSEKIEAKNVLTNMINSKQITFELF